VSASSLRAVPSPAAGITLVALLSLTAALAAPATAQTGADLETAWASLEWRTIGPAVMGGRVSDIAVVESDPRIFYVASASGGVWKTENHGASWEHLFTNHSNASIGAIAVAPSNPEIVWVGTGEPPNRQSSAWGDGVYRSEDGGRTWAHMGLTDSRHISRIKVHPANPDVVYVGAMGHLWGPNQERGLFRTTDGGVTWEKVLYIDEHTGVIDLVMDPADPEVLFAATYQRQRTAWGFNGGGPGSGIHRSLDGGTTWEELTQGLPLTDKGRIGLDVYHRDGSLLYAIVEARPRGGYDPVPGDEEIQEGIYRSTDRGETWEHMNDLNERPMYFSLIRIDPNDPQRIYDGGRPLYISDDAGRTFRRDGAQGVHSDHHALWINPADSDHLILGTDGGAYVSYDRSTTWTMLDNLPIAQFYEISVDMETPYNVCGGLQDNGTWCGPSATYSVRGILNAHWSKIYSSDGYHTKIDPLSPDIVIAEGEAGRLVRIDLGTGEAAQIRPLPRPRESQGVRAESGRYRTNWNSPIEMSTHDPATIYFGAQVLLRSTDRGQSWQEISPDLTKNVDREELEIMGVRGSDIRIAKNDGTASFSTLTTISESPLDPNVLYVGTDDGNVQVTRDGGRGWKNVADGIDVPGDYWVSRVKASAVSVGTVYLTLDGHRSDDFRPYVFVSDDFGDRWRPIVNGLPDWSVNTIAEHPRNPSLLFVGTEQGVFVSIDRGERWVPLRNNLPTVPVDDILVHPRENDLVIGTHGLGIWILDDITPLEQLSPEVLASALHLFPVRPTAAFTRHSHEGLPPQAYAAPNPPFGALIRYYPGSRLPGGEGRGEDSVTLQVKNPEGETVRTLVGPGEPGIQQVVWDLRTGVPGVPREAMEELAGFPGPTAMPGTYTVSVAGQSDVAAVEVEVKSDPRVSIAPEAAVARHGTLVDLYTLARPLMEADDVLDQLVERVGSITSPEAQEDVSDRTRDAAMALQLELIRLGQTLSRRMRRDIQRLISAVEGTTSPPTEDQEWQLAELWSNTADLLTRVNAIATEELPDLERSLEARGPYPEMRPLSMPERRGG
jgi:photosystem II stability/assembly factor-like uncharacterized protein